MELIQEKYLNILNKLSIIKHFVFLVFSMHVYCYDLFFEKNLIRLQRQIAKSHVIKSMRGITIQIVFKPAKRKHTCHIQAGLFHFQGEVKHVGCNKLYTILFETV